MIAIHILPLDIVGTGVGSESPASKDSGVPAWRTNRKWGPALVGLDAGNLPPANNRVENSSLIGKWLALAEGKLVSVAQNEALRNVVLAKPLFDLQVVGVQSS